MHFVFVFRKEFLWIYSKRPRRRLNGFRGAAELMLLLFEILTVAAQPYCSVLHSQQMLERSAEPSAGGPVRTSLSAAVIAGLMKRDACVALNRALMGLSEALV